MNDPQGIPAGTADRSGNGLNAGTALFERPIEQMVTPALARAWLATVNPGHYRPVSAADVARFRSILEQGQWDSESLDPVRIDTLGQLRGGRMRLMAIAESGISVTMLVHMPPPPQPHETIPGVYERTERLGIQIVEAIRWSGHNFDDTRAWIERQPLGMISIEHDPTHRLTVVDDARRPGIWVFPGDWLVRGGDAYSEHDHFQFVQDFLYRRPA